MQVRAQFFGNNGQLLESTDLEVCSLDEVEQHRPSGTYHYSVSVPVAVWDDIALMRDWALKDENVRRMVKNYDRDVIVWEELRELVRNYRLLECAD